jgi:hypothetical protein
MLRTMMGGWLALCLFAAVGRGESRTVTVNFPAGPTRAGVVVRPKGDNLDGREPLAKDDVVYRLAAGDTVRLEVESPPTLVAKTLTLNGDFIKITRKKETVAVIFSRTVIKRHHDKHEIPISTQLTVGRQVRVKLILRYRDKKEVTTHIPASGKLTVKLNRPADVILRMDLGPNAADGVWQDRAPNATEQATFEGHLENERRRVGADEKKLLNSPAPVTKKGNLDQLKVKVSAVRP